MNMIQTAMIAAFKKQHPQIAAKIEQLAVDAADPIKAARDTAAAHARSMGKTPDEKAAMVQYAEIYVRSLIENQENQAYKERKS